MKHRRPGRPRTPDDVFSPLQDLCWELIAIMNVVSPSQWVTSTLVNEARLGKGQPEVSRESVRKAINMIARKRHVTIYRRHGVNGGYRLRKPEENG